MADKASKLGIHVLPGIAENLPILNSTFDFVLMVTTICFVDDLKNKTYAKKNACELYKSSCWVLQLKVNYPQGLELIDFLVGAFLRNICADIQIR